MKKQDLRKEINIIIQGSHDCAEWNCWENHDPSIDTTIALFLKFAREIVPEKKIGNPRYDVEMIKARVFNECIDEFNKALDALE